MRRAIFRPCRGLPNRPVGRGLRRKGRDWSTGVNERVSAKQTAGLRGEERYDPEARRRALCSQGLRSASSTADRCQPRGPLDELRYTEVKTAGRLVKLPTSSGLELETKRHIIPL